MTNQVDEAVKKQRVHLMQKMAEQSATEFYQRFLGRELEVLFEQEQDGYKMCIRDRLKFKPKPNKITAYCKTFFDVKVIPLFKISFSRTNLDNNIPIKIANTGPPMISNSLPKK